jgi:hypothetical protein
MLNQCILVGIVHKITVTNDDEVLITLGIKKSSRTEDGLIENIDYIDVKIAKEINATVIDYIKENATVGIKARIRPVEINIDYSCIRVAEIIAEKITFINAKTNDE